MRKTGYMRHRKGIEADPLIKPLRSSNMSRNVPEWEAKWIDGIALLGRRKLYDLAVAAEKLEIRCLNELACARIACLIKGCNNEEIGSILDPESIATDRAISQD